MLCPANAIAVRQATVFRTRLGWIAVAGAGGVLADLCVGYAQRSTAWAAIAARGPARMSDCWQPLVERLAAFAAGAPDDFADVRVDLAWATPFVRRVLAACRQISYGLTCSYADLAALAGAPRAARAVGNALRANRCPLVIPCHRVVQSGGGIGGFSAPTGVRLKQRLLSLEHVAVSG